MRIRPVFTAILILFALPLSAQKITPVEGMLARMIVAYRGLPSLTYSMKGSMTIKTGAVTIVSEFNTVARGRRDNRFRVESTVKFMGEEQKGVTVSDGTTLWDLDAVANTYLERPLAEFLTAAKKGDNDWLMDRAGVDFALMFFLELEGEKAFKLKPGAEKSIQVKDFPSRMVDGRKTFVIPVPAPGGGGVQPVNAMLYVDAEDMLVRRARFTVKPPVSKGSPPMKVDFVSFYSAVKSGEELADDQFAFTPPAEAKKVEQLKGTFARAFERN